MTDVLRFFEVLLVVTLLGCGFCAERAIWFSPGTKMKNVPKEVRSSHSAYRSHYRSSYVYLGGK